MKWTRAVHHVRSAAEACADVAGRPIFSFQVTELWAVGDILGPPKELETVTVALCVDLPVEDVPWWSEPPGSQHWASATRLDKAPVLCWWRSMHAPVWNHRIDRPALVWDSATGLHEDTLAALSSGRGESVRLAAPAEDELAARLDDELAVSLGALRASTATYEDRRWRPGKLHPVADALWRASDGYLDVLAHRP